MPARAGKVLADAIAYSHGFLLTLAFLALPAVLIWPGLKGAIIVGAVLTVGGWLLLGGCFASDWERNLRRKFDTGNLTSEIPFLQRYFKGLGISTTERFTKPFGYSYAALLVLVVILR